MAATQIDCLAAVKIWPIIGWAGHIISAAALGAVDGIAVGSMMTSAAQKNSQPSTAIIENALPWLRTAAAVWLPAVNRCHQFDHCLNVPPPSRSSAIYALINIPKSVLLHIAPKDNMQRLAELIPKRL